MGWKDEFEEAQKPLEGEIVLPPRVRHGNRTGSKYSRVYDEDFMREVIEARIVKRRTLRSITDEFGVSAETISRWVGDRDSMPVVANPVRARAILADELDVIAKETWLVHAEADTAKLRLEALKALESMVRAKALLLGANAPVRHDITATVVTEAERELQEMINEAKAKAAAQEQAIIDAASNDPDL